MKAASVDEILNRHSPEIRDLVEQLRALISEAVAVAEERPYRGWHGIGYHHPASGYFCGIFPHDSFVRLGFEHGAELSDPRGLLHPASSGAKQVRYVTLRPGERVPVGDLRALLRKAVGRLR
jgi:hypothetical protein